MTSSLAEQHKTDQTNLARVLAAELVPLIVPQSDRSAVAALVRTLVALTAQYRGASSALAADYFEAERSAAGHRSAFTVPVADPLPDDQLVHSLGWATRDLTDEAVDLDAVVTRTSGASDRLALSGGRDTIVAAARADRVCRGYVRVARPDACAFCALQAIRGIDRDGSMRGVYRSAETAQRRGRGATEDKYHDHCHCTVQAIFRGTDYEPPEHVTRWAQIYADSTGGRGPKLPAFRAALDADRS